MNSPCCSLKCSGSISKLYTITSSKTSTASASHTKPHRLLANRPSANETNLILPDKYAHLSPLQCNRQLIAMFFKQGMALRLMQISSNHFGAYLLDRDFRHPAKLFPGLGGITKQGFHLGGAKISRVNGDHNITEAERRGFQTTG